MPIISVNNNESIPVKSQNKTKASPENSNEKHSSLASRVENEHWVNISEKRLESSRLGSLYAGSRFKGVQKCGTHQYNVSVDIQVNTSF